MFDDPTVQRTPLPLPYRRILVTGGDGFVGSHLVPAVARQLAIGARVIVASRFAPAGSSAADHVFFDLSDGDSIRQAVVQTQPDAVIHLAAQSSVVDSRLSAANTWSVNMAGSMNLALALRDVSPDATVMFVSSAEVYGETFNFEKVSELSAVRPKSPYARSKAAAESMFHDVLPESSRLVIVRPANHSGPGQSENFVIPAIAAQIARAERSDPATIMVGRLDSYRDFLDVIDVIDAYILLLHRAAGLDQRSVFNIASGHDVRIGAILGTMRDMAARPITVQQDPARMRASDVARTRIDNRAICLQGWRRRISLKATLRSTLLYQRNRLLAEMR